MDKLLYTKRETAKLLSISEDTLDELVELLTKDHDADEQEIRAMVQQVQDKGYSPPRREKILEFQEQQDFEICPNPDDPDACNVYNELQFPDEVYESIQNYQEKRQTS